MDRLRWLLWLFLSVWPRPAARQPPGWAAFYGPWCVLSCRVGFSADQPGAKACRRLTAAVTTLAQGHRWARHRRWRRPPRTVRPTTANRASRRRLGSPSAGGSVDDEHLCPGEEFAGHGHEPGIFLSHKARRATLKVGPGFPLQPGEAVFT